MKNKIIIYIGLFLFCFFGFSLRPNALVFVYKWNTKYCYDRNSNPNFIYRGTNLSGNYFCQNYKYVYKTKEEAYCANHNYSFQFNSSKKSSGISIEYIFDQSYANDKACTYMVKGENGWEERHDGDCSSIVGYIIHYAHQPEYVPGGKSNKEAKWLNAQIAVWTYLRRYTKHSKNYKGDYEKNQSTNYDLKGALTANDKLMLKMFRRAWKDYVNNKGTEVNNDDSSDQDMYTVTVDGGQNLNNIKFNVIPNGASCGTAKQTYKTNSIYVKNNKNFKITLEIDVPNYTSLYYKDKNSTGNFQLATDSSLTYALNANSTLEFYLVTNKKIKSEISLLMNGSYVLNGNASGVYDSKRYYPKNKKSTAQRMIILSDGESTKELSTILKFTQPNIVHKGCPASGNTSDVGSDINNSNNKVCANNSSNKDDYTVEFTNCNCMSIEFDLGKKVNILLTEKVVFRYGNLVPGVTYAGGGFKFAIGNDGYTTAYKAAITWDYADWYEGNKPYYYNANDPEDFIVTSEMEEKIVEEMKKKIMKNIELNFSTLDSNDASNINKKIYVIELELEDALYNSSEKQFDYNSKKIELKDAFFSKEGVVSYDGQNGTYSVPGGKQYYTPVKYQKNVFPFDIKNTNLSIIGEYWYNANCSIKIKFLSSDSGVINGIRYRSIDVSNPFPKDIIPDNWNEWYSIKSNETRMKQTYSNIDNPLYKVEFDTGTMTIFRNITDLYSSWNNITWNTGSSSFVAKYFNTIANNSSYCGIGTFKKECDK